ncbi:hypothetical protein EWB00_000857 [Schistosoma japonicum]|uniref:Uncharacterized protein n=1 Tax=Schistosoma japonicum TaxID=6182 RepID=A0A4Z2CKT0_SCHJA|nr:hypothetical protein EWB00_000857 [Schistosoma japonicum]
MEAVRGIGKAEDKVRNSFGSQRPHLTYKRSQTQEANTQAVQWTVDVTHLCSERLPCKVQCPFFAQAEGLRCAENRRAFHHLTPGFREWRDKDCPTYPAPPQTARPAPASPVPDPGRGPVEDRLRLLRGLWEVISPAAKVRVTET